MNGVGLAGRTVAGRYVVDRLAGEGGMGAVYRATDTQSGKTVALKVLTTAFRDAVDRFDREARVLASLGHPGIVRHVDHGRTDDGAPFLAMEWLEGEDLSQRLARGPLTLEDGAALVSPIARALSEVHARGIVHRDIKPSNIFLRDHSLSHPVLLDFGIARRADATVALTRPGNVLGTPQYMAPEQVRGDADLGPRCDVFALGCVLFECVAGRPAFAGEHAMAVLAKILLEEPPALSDLVPGAGKALDALVRAMLDKRADARPASCLAIAEQLAAKAMPESTRTPPASTLGKRERRLVAVVLGRESAEAMGRTMSPAEVTAQRELMKRDVEALGGQLTPIGPSDFVVLVPPAAAAADQAASAARCAQVVARAMPDASIALAMGWAEVEPLPVGEVIDRAASMLVERSATGIRVDEVSAGLLELRFELEGEPGQRRLGAERSSAEPPRTLLGKPTPCVGRDRELGVLMGLMGEVESDAVARVAHVIAPAGVGKSRLRYEACARITREHPDAILLVARAEAFRASASLDLLGQIVREAAGLRSDDALASARAKLLALAGDDAAPILGELAGVPFDDESSPKLAAARSDNRIIGELMQQAWLAWIGAELDKRPVILVFEDLHWADAQSVRYVDAALRDFAEKPLFVLAFSRPEVKERFPALWSGRSVQEIALPPLTARAAEKLVRAALGTLDTGAIERIVKQSEGNPLYLEEMIRASANGTAEQTSGTVLAMIQSRVESFDGDARRVMRAASVFGEAFRIEDVRAIAGDDVTPTLELLVEREIMQRRREGELAFRHALVREAAYAMLTDDDRVRAHRLAAEHLDGTAEDIVVAEHFDLGKDPARAANRYASAARAAVRKNDFEAAIAHANAALARDQADALRATALQARARARLSLGAFVEVVQDFEALLPLLGAMKPAQRMEVFDDMWHVGTFVQDAALLRRASALALALAEEEGRPEIAAEANVAVAIADHADGRCDEALARFRGSVGKVRKRPGLGLGFAGILLYHSGAHVECESTTRIGLAVATDAGDTSTQVVLTGNLGAALSGQGRYSEALDAFERGRALATRYGLTTFLARTVSISAGYPFDVWDLDEAERRSTETREIGKAIEFATPRVSAALDLAHIAVQRGQLDRARELLAAVSEPIANGRGFHGWIWRSRLAVLYAEVFAARGEWATALAHADSCITAYVPLRRVKYRLRVEHVRARALAALGRKDDAIAAAQASLAEARDYPDPAMLLRAAVTLLDLDRDERALADAADAAGRIERALPTDAARIAFRNGAPLRALR